jgi:hypothetical protein
VCAQVNQVRDQAWCEHRASAWESACIQEPS